jgi:hypothetical protein
MKVLVLPVSGKLLRAVITGYRGVTTVSGLL